MLRLINSKTEDVDVHVDVEGDVGGTAGDLVNEDDHSTATAKQKTNYAAEAVVPHNPKSSEDDDSDEGQHSSSSSSTDGKPIAGNESTRLEKSLCSSAITSSGNCLLKRKS